MQGIVYCAVLLSSLVAAKLDAQPDHRSADSLVKRGHYKQARILLDKQLAANPKDVESMVLLARVDLAYNRVDEATKLLQQAIALQANSVEAHLALAEVYGRNSDDLGMFDKMRVARLIKTETEQAVAIAPNNLDALDALVQFYLQAPGVAGGSTSKANETADKIASLDPVRGYLAKGKIALHGNEGENAEALYLKANASDPKSYQVLMQLVSFYMNTKWKSFEKAEKWAAQAVKLEGDRVTPYVVLAQIYSSGGQWAQLDELLASSEKLISDNLLPHYIAGRTLAASGKDNARAERYLRLYLTQEPEGEAPVLAGAHWRLGQVLEKEGKKTEAQKELEIALQMKPQLNDQQLREAREDLNRVKRSQT